MRRNTIQRILVLEAVRKLKSHATAEQIYDEIARAHPTVSRATVYRNLNLLAELGEIRRLEIPGSADCFDHIAARHCHVQCRECGRVFDVDMEFVTGLESRIRDTHGFEVSDYDILFHGTCPDCREKHNSK